MSLRNPAVFLLLGIMLLLFVSAVGTISPEELTRTRQNGISVRLLQIPADQPENITLSNLPERPRYDNSCMDGWGRPMHLGVNNGTATITSYGRDGKPGGEAEDSDIVTVTSLRSSRTVKSGESNLPD